MSISINTPLADAVGDAVRNKLIEIGWSMAGEDSPLSEYISLMLVNGKSREQIADELSGDLLGLPKEDQSATVFSHWLFDTVDKLKQQFSEDGGISSSADDKQQQYDQSQHSHVEGNNHQETDQHMEHDGGMDVDMAEGLSGAPPTGPKAMRNGPPRRDRLFNQLNKHLERQSDNNLRARPQSGDRISKQPPKGPRNAQNSRGGPGGQTGGRGGNRGGHMGRGGPSNFNPPGGPLPVGFTPQLTAQLNSMNPQQQLAFFQMIDQQNQILANYVPGLQNNLPMGGQPSVGPNGFRGPPGQGQYPNQYNSHQSRGSQGSLFDRIDKPPRSQARGGYAQHAGNDEDMDMGKDSEHTGFFEDKEGSGSVAGDQSLVPCKFANGCTKPECSFAHPTPVATGHVNITFTEKCPYGVKCKNRKCIGAHPSPSNAPEFQPPRPVTIQADCKYFPNCKNPVCPFRHPEMPLCRNGKNCTRPDCHFTHAETPACKFNPCLNPNCIYTHTEGQQQGKFDNKVWTAGGGKREHVSERKFQTEEADQEEELIIPGQMPQKRAIQKNADDSDVVPPGSAGSTDSSHTMNADMDAIQEDTDMPA